MGKEGKKAGFGPTGPWFRVPREITMSNEIDPYQYRILSLLLERDDCFQSTKKKTWFWCYTNWIVSHSGMGRTKVKNVLNELEEKGFITITRNNLNHQANRFHINWKAINAYKRPLTKYEMDDDEEPVILEEEAEVKDVAPVVQAQAVPFDIMDLDTDMSAEMEYRAKQKASKPSAKDWYYDKGKDFARKEYFPDLFYMESMGRGDKEKYQYITPMLERIMDNVNDEDMNKVWKEVVKPDYLKYKEYRKKQMMNEIYG